MIKDDELTQAVIRQIIYSRQTFSGEIAEALGDYIERVAFIMNSLAKEGYFDIYEGAFHNSQIHFINVDELKKLLAK